MTDSATSTGGSLPDLPPPTRKQYQPPPRWFFTKADPVPNADVVERLIRAGSHHIRSAREKSASTDEYVLHDVAIHAGAAIELFAKALLVRIDHRLAYGSAEDVYQALLDTVTSSGKTRIPFKAAKTNPKRSVQASTAVNIARRLDEAIDRAATTAHAVLGMRNGAAHAAALEVSLLPDAVTDAETFVVAVSEVLRQDTTGILGQVEYEEWSSRSSDLAFQRDETARAKILTARESYLRLVANLPAEKVTEIDQMLVIRPGPSEGDVSQDQACPACGYQDASITFVEDFEIDEDGVGGSFLAPMHFYCPRCGLLLSSEEFSYPGISIRYNGEWPAADYDAMLEDWR